MVSDNQLDLLSKENQRKIESKWQSIWASRKTFNAVPSKKKKYFATVPYPYANSILHIGHGRTYVTSDILIRYQRLKGKNVLFPMAFHISGTPVLAVADSIARGDKKQLKLTTNAIKEFITDDDEIKKIIDSFKDPLNIASFFSSKLEYSFNSLGISIDWRRDFTTGDKIYNKFIEWQFEKLSEKGLVVQGKYPILYSPKDKNAVGEDDIKDGDTDKVSISEMTSLFFKLVDSDEYLVPTTLRPETIFGATNLWLNPTATYIRVKVNDKIWIVSKDSLVKLKHQFDDVVLLSELSGTDLIGRKVVVPLVNREVPIIKATFVDPTHATGVVYSVPAHAPFDNIALKNAQDNGDAPKNMEIYTIIDLYDKKTKELIRPIVNPASDKISKYNIQSQDEKDKLDVATKEIYKEEFYGGILNALCGDFANIPVKKIKDQVKDYLIKSNFAVTFLETSRIARTRSGDQVIVANLDGQWFLDYSNPEVKERAYKLLDSMSYYPEKLKESQKGYLEWVQKRPCARKRGLGTKLPQDKNWIIEPLSDSTIYQLFYLIVHIIKENNISPEKLKPILFDYLYLDKFDIDSVSIETNISKDLIKQMKSEVDYWGSFDLRYTAPAHMSNHLSFLIYHYANIISKEYLHPKNIVIGGLLIKNGEKISKSKGNGIPLNKIKDLFGADLYRLYISLASNIEAEMDFNDDEILQLEKKFIKLKQYLLEAKLNSLNLNTEYSSFSNIDKWLISKFYSRAKTYFQLMDDNKIRDAHINIIYEFLNDIHYHERRTNLYSTINVISFFIDDFLKLLVPTIPHICEEIYNLNNSENNIVELSLQTFETNFDNYIDKSIEDVEKIVENLINTISKARENKKLNKISKITIIQAKDSRFDLFNKLFELLETTRNFKDIMQSMSASFPHDKKFISKFIPKTLGSGLSTYLQKDDEKKLIESVLDFIKTEFNTDLVDILSADDIEGYNSNSNIPGKPAVILE